MPAAERGPRSVVADLSNPPAHQARHRKRPAVIDVKHVVPVTLLAQFCVGLAVAGVAGVWFDATAGVSALLGSATAVIPNGFLAARLIASNRDARDHAMLRAARVGEF